jgi:hypothetical protein
MEYRYQESLAIFVTQLRRQLARGTMRARTSVKQTLITFHPKTTNPFGSSFRADIELGCGCA